MKQLIWIIVSVFIFALADCLTLSAQNPELWGMCYYTGAQDSGVIFSYNLASDSFQVRYNFSGGQSDGAVPYGSLSQASDGKLYGMTNTGGQYFKGILFSYDIPTSTLTKLHDFSSDSVNGAYPNGSLLQASNGLLYGMTILGGPRGDSVYSGGTLFSYNISTSEFKVLYGFGPGGYGALPANSLIQANDSILLATTLAGGSGNGGTIFSYNIPEDSLTILYNFPPNCCTEVINGFNPYCNLYKAKNGLYYGTTNIGGDYSKGCIFSFDLATDSEKMVYSFNGTSDNIVYVRSTLLGVGDSLLYGGGYSNVFAYNFYTNHISTYQGFTSQAFYNAGNGYLYGMSEGEFFKLNTLNNSMDTVHEFDANFDYIGQNGTVIGVNDTFCMVSHDTLSMARCNGDTVHIGPYSHTTTGLYTDTLSKLQGCDSIITLSLTINQSPSVTLNWQSIDATYMELISVSADTLFCYGMYWNTCNCIALTGGFPIGGVFSGTGIINDTLFQNIIQNSTSDTSIKDQVSYIYTDSNGCFGIAFDSLNFTICTAIDLVSSATSFSLYPNPATDFVVINVDPEFVGSKLELIDVTGRVVYFALLENTNVQLPIAYLSPGIYAAILSNYDGKSFKLLLKE